MKDTNASKKVETLPVKFWCSSQYALDEYLSTGDKKNLTTTWHETDMASMNWVQVGEGLVTFTSLVSKEELLVKATEAVQAEIRKVQANAEAAINALKDQLSKYQPLPAPKEGEAE